VGAFSGLPRTPASQGLRVKEEDRLQGDHTIRFLAHLPPRTSGKKKIYPPRNHYSSLYHIQENRPQNQQLGHSKSKFIPSERGVIPVYT